MSQAVFRSPVSPTAAHHTVQSGLVWSFCRANNTWDSWHDAASHLSPCRLNSNKLTSSADHSTVQSTSTVTVTSLTEALRLYRQAIADRVIPVKGGHFVEIILMLDRSEYSTVSLPDKQADMKWPHECMNHNEVLVPGMQFSIRGTGQVPGDLQTNPEQVLSTQSSRASLVCI